MVYQQQLPISMVESYSLTSHVTDKLKKYTTPGALREILIDPRWGKGSLELVIHSTLGQAEGLDRVDPVKYD